MTLTTALRAAAAMLLVLALAACGGPSSSGSDSGESRHRHVAASTHVEDALFDLERCLPAEAVAGPYSDVAALESLRLGYVDVAITWGLRPEVDEALVVTAVGSDGLAFIVHPSNQTGPLGKDSLRRLFSGDVSDWGAFGQSSGAVLPVSREEGAGSREALMAMVMGEAPVSSGAAIAGSDSDVLDYVASRPGAIGYVAASNLREGVRALTVEGGRPEPQRVREGEYPLMVGVWLVYTPDGRGEDLDRCLRSSPGALARWYGAPELLD